MLKLPPNPFERIVHPFRGFARLVSPAVVETVQNAVEAVKDMATALAEASVDAETNSAPVPEPEPDDAPDVERLPSEYDEVAEEAAPAETRKRKGRRGKKVED